MKRVFMFFALVGAFVRNVLSSKIQNDPRYTENWINVKKISNGICYKVKFFFCSMKPTHFND